MQASILIVSKNRKEELERTLLILEKIIDPELHEILVFLDGCTDNSFVLKDKFERVKWESSKKSIGASGARHFLYPKAKGQFLIGLDDDAHPLFEDFILRTLNIFAKYPNVGIVAFEEIKGIYNSDEDALRESKAQEKEYFTNEFIGCGFAIRKEVYETINGFPVWIDIYGEESCVSMEVLAKGYDIIYSNKVKVNHRVNIEERKLKRQNYFRFGKQLKNTTYYYLVYYPFPLVSILKLYGHNFIKYGLMDFTYFKIFVNTIIEVIKNVPKVISYRNPMNKSIIIKMRKLSPLKF